jgi:hypothetical protein
MAPRPIHWSGLVWINLLTDVRCGSRPPRVARREGLRLAGQPLGLRHHRSDESGVALVTLPIGPCIGHGGLIAGDTLRIGIGGG